MDKKKKLYKKSSNFIPLNDYHLFIKVKKPEGATNYLVWYDKDEGDWGVTITAASSGETHDKNYIWKASWINCKSADGASVLTPTKDSVTLGTETIDGDLYQLLNSIVENHRSNYKKKASKII